jgi:Chaperone of endosialidase
VLHVQIQQHLLFTCHEGVLAMTTIKHVALILTVTLFSLLATVQAQTARLSTINVTSDGERVRVAAQGDVSEMRLEVVSEAGEIVFESGAITGQQIDWNMKDAQGERVAAGTYLVTITFRNASGKSRKRVEQVSVEEAETAAAKPAAPQAVQATVTTTNAGVFGSIARFTGASTIANSVITQTTAGNIGIGTTAPVQTLQVNGITSLGAPGSVYGYLVAGSSPGPYPTIGFNTYGTGYRAGVTGYGGIFQFQDGDGKLIYYTGSNVAAGAAHAVAARFVIDKDGKVGIGTTNPINGKLHVNGGSGVGVYSESTGSYGVYGGSTSYGVVGSGSYGVYGDGVSYGVFGVSHSGYAGFFRGKAKVTGNLEAAGGLTVTGGACTGCARVQSDQNLKTNFSTVNPRFVLDRLARLPIRQWNYKTDEPSVRHIGPMAQDFRIAFNLGVDDKHIDMIDANGVTMAAIQGLYQMVQEKDKKNEQLASEVQQLRAQVRQQQAQLNQVKRTIKRKRTARR